MAANGQGREVDKDKLMEVYKAFALYKMKNEEHVAVIRAEIKKLTEAGNLEGMSGGRGDILITSIRTSVASIENITIYIDKLAKFIDSKLEAMGVLKEAKQAAEVLLKAEAVKKKTVEGYAN